MTACKACERRISAYVDNELSPALSKELETHLATCAHCRRLRDEVATLASAARGALPAVSDEEWGTRWRAISSELPSTSPEVIPFRRSISLWIAEPRRQWVPMAAAAVLLLALVLGFRALLLYGAADRSDLSLTFASGNPPELLDSFCPDYTPLYLGSPDRNVAIVWLVEQEEAPVGEPL